MPRKTSKGAGTRKRAVAGPEKLVGPIAEWFSRSARTLPWRTNPRDPWRSLVSEFMLQQTQVSRVLEKFEPFLDRFPTPGALAAADEADVLAMWSGLGYYRRAKLLQAAAKAIVEKFSGLVPGTVDELVELPGVGRYTAGAVASIVFDQAAPIVDGNVARVLLRIHGREQTASQAAAWVWERAEGLAKHAGRAEGRKSRIAAFNEGLMELGAVVCTPRNPKCDQCPVVKACAARELGLQDRIPKPKQATKRKLVLCEVIVVHDAKGRVLLERRPERGMWAGLWQAPTLERVVDEIPSELFVNTERATLLAKKLCLGRIALNEIHPRPFIHQTSHREVYFHVWEGLSKEPQSSQRRWATTEELAGLAVSNAQRRILSDHLHRAHFPA